MPGKNLIEKTKAKLQERRFTTLLSDDPSSGLYLFFSFDLVNSTQFKASRPKVWPVVVTRFYEFVTAELTTRLTSAILWKYVGDEVLFYKRVISRNDFHRALPAAFDALNASIELLHKNYPYTREILSVKATAWAAVAAFIKPSNIEGAKIDCRNIIIPSLASSSRDFLGPDIDVGFRISKFALRRRLVVSAHLAWLLHRERQGCPAIRHQLRIIGFEPLKGVWDGRHYPIIWFERNWKRLGETFLYDEHFSSETIRKLIKPLGKEGRLELIDKVFSDLGKEEEVQEMLHALRMPMRPANDDLVEIEIPPHKYSEVHCVAVCFSQDGKVLAAKRPASKKRFPNAFEFGCGQLKLGDTFGDCLRRAYKDDFGVELRVEDHPVPFRSFSINDQEEHRIIPGIIFIAEIESKASVVENYSRQKHSEVKWIDPAHFKPLHGQKYVPDFKTTLKTAHGIWLELKRKRPFVSH